jgi:hypothetical protein
MERATGASWWRWASAALAHRVRKGERVAPRAAPASLMLLDVWCYPLPGRRRSGRPAEKWGLAASPPSPRVALPPRRPPACASWTAVGARRRALGTALGTRLTA